MKSEDLKIVMGQQEYTREMYSYMKTDNLNLERYNKVSIAEKIGRELLKNGLIKFEEFTQPNGNVVKRGTVWVYQKSEDD